ncbi:MarR family winged helix-turn-helix transcriptional regulator [Shinella zoogloeoides]|uniref:LexA family protein n=1 Tax=Shinella zoogloeoides TaxID=352475 RepID=UPI000E64EDAF|nr:MarR family winged helix-turn-helix transcriptional regulator [Shinella zoogloeoides]
MKLTEPQARVLSYLARRKEDDGPPSGPEISKALGHPSYWAAGKLSSLERRGLVERLGTSFFGGNCYRITPAGRNALDKENAP